MTLYLNISRYFPIFSAIALGDYEEKRDLSLPTGNIQKFVMECGAGSLEIRESKEYHPSK